MASGPGARPSPGTGPDQPGRRGGILHARVGPPYLTRDRERLDAILDIARGFAESGDKASAIALVREVLRGSPAYPPAKRLQRELEPPPEPTK